MKTITLQKTIHYITYTGTNEKDIYEFIKHFTPTAITVSNDNSISVYFPEGSRVPNFRIELNETVAYYDNSYEICGPQRLTKYFEFRIYP